ncbi:MAG: dinitrogenase iron-molybdenum cofactor biosynthesis protein [Proteobacteria bacterium]|nr:dinitrogenase iron-molybdenum cofactor biosynthesis protein [Pseudomonadota bacterium]MBU1737763.1 dinitrogenase iron-molybdenum cofactor biosynthesis protein [Pseudomonadota bacterium]
MQVAIVSTDGMNVDEHFGRAARFLIYEVEGGTRLLLANRVSHPLSDGDTSHDFNPERFSQIAENLVGCEKVYCTKIGEKPSEELKKLGIEAVLYEGPIKGIGV